MTALVELTNHSDKDLRVTWMRRTEMKTDGEAVNPFMLNAGESEEFSIPVDGDEKAVLMLVIHANPEGEFPKSD